MMQELFYSIARALQWDSLVQRYLEGLFGAHDLPHRSQVIRMYHDWNAASGSVQGDAASSVRTTYLHGSVP